MTTVDYISESTENLIRRAEQTLGEIPVLDLTNWQVPIYIPGNATIRSLAPSCKRIQIKNIVTVVDSSITICTGPTVPGDCGTPFPVSCPVGVSPLDYVNIVAKVTAQAPQAGLKIVFDYLLDDVPLTTAPISFDISAAEIAAGGKNVYAFGANVQYIDGQSLTLHGVRQV